VSASIHSARSNGDFAEAIHLIKSFRTGPENEFVDAHILLALDRVFDGCF
jgi:hypothetical protein